MTQTDSPGRAAESRLCGYRNGAKRFRREVRHAETMPNRADLNTPTNAINPSVIQNIAPSKTRIDALNRLKSRVRIIYCWHLLQFRCSDVSDLINSVSESFSPSRLSQTRFVSNKTWYFRPWTFPVRHEERERLRVSSQDGWLPMPTRPIFNAVVYCISILLPSQWCSREWIRVDRGVCVCESNVSKNHKGCPWMTIIKWGKLVNRSRLNRSGNLCSPELLRVLCLH